MKVSIVIKALNEEESIERCIKSALKSIKGISGEIILVDSISTDKTIEISKKYPIRILQLKNPEDLKAFDTGGYAFNPRMSNGDDWVFTRG